MHRNKPPYKLLKPKTARAKPRLKPAKERPYTTNAYASSPIITRTTNSNTISPNSYPSDRHMNPNKSNKPKNSVNPNTVSNRYKTAEQKLSDHMELKRNTFVSLYTRTSSASSSSSSALSSHSLSSRKCSAQNSTLRGPSSALTHPFTPRKLNGLGSPALSAPSSAIAGAGGFVSPYARSRG